MESERFARVVRTTNLHLAMEATDALRKVEEGGDKPPAMAYFYELCRQAYSGARPLPEGTHRIGTMCVQVPDELIYAAGGVPHRLCCGANAYDQAGAEFMPAKSCSVVRATTGMLHVRQSDLAGSLAAVIIPTTCDLKRKTGETIEDMGFAVHYLEMPPAKDSAAARFYWQESVKGLALALERITGRRITRKGLATAIARVGAASAQFRRLCEVRKATVPVISGRDAFLVTNSYFFDEIDSWTKALTALNDELEVHRAQGAAACTRQAPRLIFTGSPPIFPNLKVPVLVEQAGGIIVADEVCSASRLLYDTVSFDEAGLYDMIPAIADRYLKACTCPCLAPNRDRERKLLEMAAAYRADGVIYQAFSGCLPYEMEQKRISAALAAKGIPMLYVETDYSPEDLGQLSTRVEAFIESVKVRTRRQKQPMHAI